MPTPHPKVLRAINGELPAGVSARLCVLIAAAEQRQPEPVLRALLTAMVPEATRSDDALGALPAVGHGNGNGHVSGNGNGNGNGSHPAGVAGTGAGDADGAPSRRPPHRSIPSTP